MTFVKEFQLASVHIDTIQCIVSVFLTPFSAGQLVLHEVKKKKFSNTNIEI